MGPPEPIPDPTADHHVHSQFSWDAPCGSMEETCQRAQELGLTAIAFTDHADYSELCQGARLDVEGYLEVVEGCRRLFPGLSISTGVELGEPHRHRDEAAAVLARGRFDVVLGSVHGVPIGGGILEISEIGPEPPVEPGELVRAYLEETIRMIEGPIQFEILTHFEYPRRFWPHGWPAYRSGDHRRLIEEVLAEAADRGLVLEFNTTRGGTPERSLCPAPEVLGWWRRAGGRAISFGSDAHDPGRLAAGFERAARLAAGEGFHPNLGRAGIWSG